MECKDCGGKFVCKKHPNAEVIENMFDKEFEDSHWYECVDCIKEMTQDDDPREAIFHIHIGKHSLYDFDWVQRKLAPIHSPSINAGVSLGAL